MPSAQSPARRRADGESGRHHVAGFRALFDHSPAGAFILQRGQPAYVNASLADIYGLSPAELANGRSIADLVAAEDLASLRSAAREVLRKPDSDRTVSFRGVREGGSVLQLEVTLAGVEMGGRHALVGTVVDVTERVRAEQEHREAEERFALVMRATSNAVFDWDLTSNAIYWNDTMHSAFRYGPDDVGDTPDWWSERIHPEDQRQVLTSIQSALAQDARFWTGEYRFRQGDGSYATVLGRAYIARADGGKAVRMVGAMVDVTEHRQLEERFYQSQRMEAIGRLAGGVAHDLNNVLMIVQGTTDLLLREPELSESVRADLGKITKAADRAASLTRQLLAFGRRQVLRPEVVDLNATITELEAMLHRIIGEDIELITRLDPELARVRVDPRQIEQVLLNLVANARDGMPGGGTLTIGTEDVYLSESDADRFTYPVLPGKYVRVCVQDTGTGMEPSTLAQIFEPFFTTKPRGKGSGLGLSTAYGIIKQSGGYIWVTSKVGEGSTFDIYLPQTDAPLSAPKGSPEPASLPRGSGTILLVEDDEAVRAVARRILDLGGYVVLEARSGPDALQICQRHRGRLDALVTDVVMPQMSGPELANQILATRPGLSVLYMSGHTDDRMLQHGLGREQVNFIQKPFRPDALLHRVQALLRQRR